MSNVHLETAMVDGFVEFEEISVDYIFDDKEQKGLFNGDVCDAGKID